MEIVYWFVPCPEKILTHALNRVVHITHDSKPQVTTNSEEFPIVLLLDSFKIDNLDPKKALNYKRHA